MAEESKPALPGAQLVPGLYYDARKGITWWRNLRFYKPCFEPMPRR